MNPLRQVAQTLLPQTVFNKVKTSRRGFIEQQKLRKAYRHDYDIYRNGSATFGADSLNKALGKIIKNYHVIEKGLTMPDRRLGFGQERLVKLIQECKYFIQKNGDSDPQLIHTLSVIKEYQELHETQGFQLQDQTKNALNSIKPHLKNVTACKQKETTREDYFKHTSSPFIEFSNSRSSVRNYSEEKVDIDLIRSSLELAKNTPSACNRQSWRTYVYTNKQTIEEILEKQGGNRGFGHLAGKLIIITAEVGVFSAAPERYQAYVDGGMYAMNLLYALHANRIAACILNCSHAPAKDKELRLLCQIKDTEVFIAMITCGIPPERFQIAVSQRHAVELTNTTN